MPTGVSDPIVMRIDPCLGLSRRRPARTSGISQGGDGIAEMAIDVHAHFVPGSLLLAARSRKQWYGLSVEVPERGKVRLEYRGRTYTWGEKYWWSPRERVAEMNSRRVEIEILSISGPLFGYSLPLSTTRQLAAEANAEAASYYDAAPDRFRALATLPIQDPAAAADELERAMARKGFVGAVVGATVPQGSWSHEAYEPLLVTAERTGALLLVHPTPMESSRADTRYAMNDLLGQPDEISVAWCEFAFGGVLDRHPALRVCFAQGGGVVSFLAGRFEFGSKTRMDMPRTSRTPMEYVRSCYYDSLTYSESSLRALVDVAGSERVLLGSDHPSHMSLPDPVGWIESLQSLTSDQKAAILTKNAMTMLTRKDAGVGGAQESREGTIV